MLSGSVITLEITQPVKPGDFCDFFKQFRIDTRPISPNDSWRIHLHPSSPTVPPRERDPITIDSLSVTTAGHNGKHRTLTQALINFKSNQATAFWTLDRLPVDFWRGQVLSPVPQVDVLGLICLQRCAKLLKHICQATLKFFVATRWKC